MPLYEYHCLACGADFEHLRRRGNEPDPACACGSERVERIPFSRVAVAVGGSRDDAGAGPCANGDGGCCGGTCGMN